jgi:tetratricopeptide (TPR) repeat protein/CHAT domain-containing protein
MHSRRLLATTIGASRIARHLMCAGVLWTCIHQTSFGEPDKSVASQAVRQQILALQSSGKIAEAIALAEKERSRREADGITSNSSLRECLSILGQLYRSAREFKKAEAALRTALAMYPDDVDAPDLDKAKTLSQLGWVLVDTGHSEEAEERALQALEICNKKLPPIDAGFASIKSLLAQIYKLRGRMADALRYAQEAREVAVQVFTESHQNTLSCYQVEGQILRHWGKFKDAEKCFVKILSISKRTKPPNDGMIAATDVDLASVYFNQARYADSERLLAEAETIVQGQLHPRRNMLYSIAYQRANLAMAQAQYKSALTYVKTAEENASQPQERGQIFELKAEIYDRLGKYGDADHSYHEALSVYEKAYGKDSPILAHPLTSLGSMYQRLGDYKRARKPIEDAYRICQQAFKSENFATANAAAALGSLDVTEQNFVDGDKLLSDALSTLEHLGFQEHVVYASALANLANSQRLQKKFDDALKNASHAADLYKKLLGPNHPNYGGCLRDLALTLHGAGKYKDAEGQYRLALSIFKNALGENHFYTLEVLDSLAALQFDQGENDEAIKLSSQAAKVDESILKEILSYAPEAQRLAYVHTRANPYTLLATLGLSEELAKAVLREKMIISDSIQEERGLALATRANGTPLIEKVTRRAALQSELYALQLGVPEGTPQPRIANASKRIAETQAELEATESELARSYAKLGTTRRSFRIGKDQVQGMIRPKEALVEYFRFPYYVGKGYWKSAYAAVVFSHEGDAQWRLLGTNEKGEIVEDAGIIDKRIKALTLELRKTAPDLPDETTVEDQLLSLHRILWQPLEALFPPGANAVIISPDAALNNLSFAALLEKAPAKTDDRKLTFLAERYLISYVSTGRDLATEDSQAEASPLRPALLVISPQFSQKPGPQAPAGPFPQFEPLLNATEIAADLKKAIGAKLQCASPLIGQYATEQEIRKQSGPSILHFYTHGFFLAPTSKNITSRDPQVGFNQVLDDPMRRSGLALAGANDTFRTWDAQLSGNTTTPIPPNDDGVLTAEEAAEMDLRGTWLVTLAACDTGIGDIIAGEGVMGLRRAFALNGAQNVMLTLWPIRESYARDFVRKFYARALEMKEPTAALASVQREELRDLAKKDISTAVQMAAPFVISFRRFAPQTAR